MAQRSDALIVFARTPEPGRVKTRLTSLLSEEEAAYLYAAFLADALHAFSELDADVRLYLADDGPPLGDALAASSVHRQVGGCLGERMFNAFVDTFQAGHERVVVIGTDHPTLPTDFVRLAFEQLAVPRSVTVGPSEDGGYYLLGMNDLFPSLFQDIAFSQPTVFEETISRASEATAALTILPLWYDVDTPDDLVRLAQDLRRGADSDARRTREALANLRSAHPVLG